MDPQAQLDMDDAIEEFSYALAQIMRTRVGDSKDPLVIVEAVESVLKHKRHVERMREEEARRQSGSSSQKPRGSSSDNKAQIVEDAPLWTECPDCGNKEVRYISPRTKAPFYACYECGIWLKKDGVTTQPMNTPAVPREGA